MKIKQIIIQNYRQFLQESICMEEKLHLSLEQIIVEDIYYRIIKLHVGRDTGGKISADDLPVEVYEE